MLSRLFILWLNNKVCIYHNLFMCSSDDGYLDCFHLLAISNSAVMSIHVHVLVFSSFGYIYGIVTSFFLLGGERCCGMWDLVPGEELTLPCCIGSAEP